MSNAGLFGVEELRRRGCEGNRREGKPGVDQTLGSCHLRDRRPQSLNVRVTKSPMVHVHGLHRTEAVQSLQLVSWESVDGLQEGVVCELEGRVQGDRSVQGFAPHLDSDLCRGHGENPGGGKKEKEMSVVCVNASLEAVIMWLQRQRHSVTLSLRT